MKEISVKSYAKINLSLDVLGILPSGYHQVEMIMQQLDLHDVVTVRWTENPELPGVEIRVESNRADLPVSSENLAYKAAERMAQELGKRGTVYIFLQKNIPVAAGLAGGSGNGAAVLHSLNALWEAGLSVKELCRIGLSLGADVPFCIMGQAKGNPQLGDAISGDPLACTCAYAEGIGERLTPLPALPAYVLLSKPPLGVSTAEVYRGIDEELGLEKPEDGEKLLVLQRHMDTKALIEGIKSHNYEKIIEIMANLLELFTIKQYPIIMYTKDKIVERGNAAKVLMSGSGPTVFALYFEEDKMNQDYEALCDVNEETYATKTLR
ncbi:4-(cytidine 5'-diphospho)-2-C-methyl-D-erythritol kinase [Aminipila butyrica]|uniref:4-diphosphocytidyl-2-C-methyl-D-erythritol kinase n=1 Tax=Aminipila butyrica TaxID=433296 RepID=A0A858BTM3_9FIRM|nr:4-(cytidine 5'-diphospho)-2-C-methyl-D-erythritol kinase [Aminipila butyrica]QIB68124.1 4-(cytidine 5'-diphospho)-2-C-methyl-D-erythritol kinase [Aminipila butyrica]